MSSYPIRYRHVVGGIYAGGAPNQDNIATLAQMGVRYVLSLDQDVAEKIKPWLDQYKIKQIVIPIFPLTVMDDNLKYLSRNIPRILSSFQPIYVHCLHGSDRTGLAIAIYRIAKQHYSVPQALREAKNWNYGAGISPATQKLWENLLLSVASQYGVLDSHSIEDGSAVCKQEQMIYPPTVSLQSGAPEGIYPASFAPYLAESLTDESNRVMDGGFPMVGNRIMVGPAGGGAPVENQSLINVETYL